VKIPAVLRLGGELAWRSAVDATNPTREVTLIGETGACRDFSQSGPSGEHERDGALQPHAHNITMRRHAHRLGEHAGEVERAAPSDVASAPTSIGSSRCASM
jgi:hypothetical protein